MVNVQTTAHVKRMAFTSFGGEKDANPAKKIVAEQQVTAPPPPAPPPPAAFSEKDMQAAKDKAFAEGHREGKAQAEEAAQKAGSAREEAIQSVLEIIANRITLAAETHVTHLKNQQEVLGKTVLAIAQKVAGEALRRDPYVAIESLLKDCVDFIVREPRIVIAVCPALAPGLKQRVDGLRPHLPGFEGELLVEEDAVLGEQDCRVEWKSGYSERNSGQLWKEIEAVIAKTSINLKE